MGEHSLKNGFREYPQTVGTMQNVTCREHQFGVIVSAQIPSPAQASPIVLNRVVCLKCGSVVDPFPEFSNPEMPSLPTSEAVSE